MTPGDLNDVPSPPREVARDHRRLGRYAAWFQAMSKAIRRLLIRGRVQGVGYRAWVEYQARRRGLNGWVRNRRDGGVEAVFEGDASVVADMATSCRQGPASARVDDVAEETASTEMLGQRHAGEAFSVLPTI
jgi:acylphosphatase